MKAIFPENAPKPAGHYSPAIVHNGLVFVSGQIAVDPETGEKRLGSIEEQTELILNNIGIILRAAGSDLNHLLKTTAYIEDMELWGAVNQVYAKVLGDHRPARAIIPAKGLHHGFLIEIEAIAATIRLVEKS
ncbi:MAG TPA: Rid family detoxifying hydrolase [Blastocatellia bacterium]|nr:Rid family detoxifying hydrolase [Blastocatellia bacterium]